ncbi:MAG TPA: 2'-5' RNA ligase family protein [Streptosporangiaceae bacterium]
MPLPTESAVVVRIPEAEQAVGTLRARLDSAAALGVPAHVTVLAPFVPPAALDPAVLTALATAVGSVAAFRATFERVAWFGDRVVWLAPEPAARFVALTKAVWAAFPGCPPYGGAFDDVVPHLTIGDGQPAGVLAEAERAVLPVLPVIASVRAVTLMQGSREPGSWQVLAEFPLGP